MSDLRSPVRMSNDWALVDRRIRHVTAIQIRNLTPFPARDSLASALTQPAEQSQFTSHGHLSDDLDVAMQRKRSRRISVNSVTTHRSMRSEDGMREEGLPGATMIERGRRTSGPRVSFPSEGGDHRQRATSGSAPTIRPHRARTSSMASSAASHTSSPSLSTMSHLGGSSSAAASSFSAMLPDNSQTGLEKVIQSRLVETFLAITIPQPSTPSVTPNDSAQPTSPLKSPNFRDKPSPSKPVEGNVVRKVVKPPHLLPTEKSSAKARRDSATSPRVLQKPSLSHVKSASTSILRTNGDVKRAPPYSSPAPLAQKPPSKLETSTPNYFSPIHRPSTHPYFAIDARSTPEFTEDTDCSGYEMRIEVWGRVHSRWRVDTLGKGKEKEANGADSGAEWKILDERNVDLRDLVPLSENSVTDNSQLPSNSLLITLSPPGETFYLPPHPPFRHRSPSPSGGYASDPESDVRRVKPTGMATPPASAALIGHNDATTTALSRRRHRGGVGAATVHPEEVSKTAGWQDLFKLVTLKSCILDNGRSLSDVVRGIDKSLEADIIFAQRREVSEREARLEELAAYHKKVAEEADQLRNQIQTRLDNLGQRKHLLKLAREQLEGEVAYEHEMEEAIVQDRALHSSLRSRFGPTRTTLLSILSSIYPIELLSPPDLLYTILDVPLPIPLSSSDPAPPLIMPLQKDVNEDAVATSLGYAAQVVQLLAAYLGKGLVYPVTCIGSRSLIKDNISAMVGPRMFPLYSKGVDTYRFEYGVFLLNKNIELLMADRDLRALDMRHTLPNLKNLLLTLTDGEGARLRQSRPPDSPMSLASNLESLSRPGSPVDPNSITPKAPDPTGLDGSTPPASGSTTPTAATTDASKKGRPFLAFSPLTDFLRGRYSSSSPTSVKGSPNPSEEVHISKECHATPTADQSSEQQAGGGGDGDNDERKAISDISRAVSVVEGWKPDPASIANGEEPALDEEDLPAHATPLLPLTRVR